MIKGIIFDMDNTLLQSRIDFGAMKRDVYNYLQAQGFLEQGLQLTEYTTSMLIEQAKRQGLDAGRYTETMRITRQHEIVGMSDATLEPEAESLLSALEEEYVLVVVTNNAEEAATEALTRTGIASRFQLIVGRESMTEMKPGPSGYQEVVKRTGIPAEHWLSIGDSWIDGRGSIDAGIRFVGYQTKDEELASRGVEPIARLTRLSQLLDTIQIVELQ
ncbi:HAD family hydrolase [Paenibacillus terricola]|uniref:HAD family hydrolase n=1 Tax=Paenibacillus terricola TaxID=2763503 RepID=UPI001CD0A198|nr:HAD family hydrolase [Paenibacillus terricola]